MVILPAPTLAVALSVDVVLLAVVVIDATTGRTSTPREGRIGPQTPAHDTPGLPDVSAPSPETPP